MAEQARFFDEKPLSPGEHLRAMLEEKGWTQDDLAAVAGYSRQQINDIISGRRGITAEMAVALAAAFGTTPGYWMKLDSDYRLSQVDAGDDAVRQRAMLFALAPVKDMQRRGWIKPTKDLNEIEDELRRFFGVSSLDIAPEFPVSFRKTSPLSDLTAPQRAWCFRVRQVASALQVPTFDPTKMPALKKELRILAAYPAEAGKVSDTMRCHGIRFVVVEPLPSSKLDGCAFWLDAGKPVIGVSLLRDRLDNFWFTLMHEVAHIENGDDLSVDTDLGVEERSQPLLKDAQERRADEAAAACLIPNEELDSFIRRVGPLYAKPNIIQFAHRIKIHPAVIVGQLQHRGELGFQANREMLSKVRDHVVSTALTDGWGNQISPDSI